MRRAPSGERSVFIVPVIFMSLSVKILGPFFGFFRHGQETVCSRWGGGGWGGVWAHLECDAVESNVTENSESASHDHALQVSAFPMTESRGWRRSASVQEALASVLILIGTDGQI